MIRRINNLLKLLLGVILILLLSGCASYYGKQAFDDAERLAQEENWDQAVEKYFEASELEPSNKAYKLKLIASRTRAAAFHIRTARKLTEDGRYDEAIEQYQLARGFDPSLGVAALEEKTVTDILEAQTLVEESERFYRERRLSLARRAAKKALQRDPSNARAKALLDIYAKDGRTVAMDGTELDLASSDPITLRFKDAQVKEVFNILTQLTGINFILDEDIRDQSISVLLEKASFAQSLELILQLNKLSKKVLNSKTLIIYPQSKEKEKVYEDQVIQTFYLSHIDAKKAVNLLRTMLQLRKIYVHEERNALVIRDKPEVIKLAEQILNAADRANSEVIFDLEIVSVNDTDSLNIGPELSTYSIGVGLANEGADSLLSDVLIKDLGTDSESEVATGRLADSLKYEGVQNYFTVPSMTFNFAKTLTGTEILASPKIRVRNNEKAKVHIGTREPVITVTTTGDTSTDNIQYVDVGTKLDVEPKIQLDGTIETKLTLEVSQVLDRFQTDNGSVALTISTTNAQSVLTLQDGVQTIIGGLFEQNSQTQKTTIPFFGEIPLLGNLISSNSNNAIKREILLSITPHIVMQVEVPEASAATIWSGGEDNLKAGPNFGAFAVELVSEVESTTPQAVPSLRKPVADVTIDTEIPGGEEPSIVPDQIPAEAEMTAALEETEEPETPIEIEDVKMLVEQEEAEAVIREAEAEAEIKQMEAEVEIKETEAETEIKETEQVVDPPVIEQQVETETIPPPSDEPPVVLDVPGEGEMRLSIDGPQTIASGQVFSLEVGIMNASELYSAPLFVSYDPEVLELIDLSEGGFLKQNGQSTVFSSSPNRTTGQVIVGYKQGVGGQGASGSGTLFEISFRPKKAGMANIELNRINFRDPEGARLQVNSVMTTIEIR